MKITTRLAACTLALLASSITHKLVAAEQSTTDIITQVSGQTPKLAPFVSSEAPVVADLQAGGFSTTPAFEDNFDPGWEKTQTSWQVATWKQNKTQMAKSRCKTNGKGQLVQTVLAGNPPRGGSLQTTREFGYGRWIARLKPADVPGVLNSMFTKDWDSLKTSTPHDGLKAEVDIELLSKTYGPDSGEVHLAIHLKNHTPLWHLDIPLDFNPSDNYRLWGFDILPDRVIWHVDGKQLYEWEYTDEHKIDPDYEFFFNSWTNKKWIAGPPQKNAEYFIDWVKFYPYLGNGTDS